MPRVAVLIAASPNPAFLSQIAALALSLRELRWQRWKASLHVFLGGDADPDVLRDWAPHLADVELSWVSGDDGIWAQSDAVFEAAPDDADVLLTMDADTFAVAPLEDVLDRVVATSSVAGVIAHYPLPPGPDASPRDAWERLAGEFLERPLEFPYSHTLVAPDAPADRRPAPFYVNFGAVFFPRAVFADVAARYLPMRRRLMSGLFRPEFSGQAALTLALAQAGARTWALPMRFNFPNDPIAERMYPEELERVAIFHYLRTQHFDRHLIFTSADEYRRFLELPLVGVNGRFQRAVRTACGAEYPFG